jgi:hypothetical protein
VTASTTAVRFESMWDSSSTARQSLPTHGSSANMRSSSHPGNYSMAKTATPVISSSTSQVGATLARRGSILGASLIARHGAGRASVLQAGQAIPKAWNRPITTNTAMVLMMVMAKMSL